MTREESVGLRAGDKGAIVPELKPQDQLNRPTVMSDKYLYSVTLLEHSN